MEDKCAITVLTNKLHNELSDVISGIDCIEGIFTMQVKEGSWQYQSFPQKGSICFAETPYGRAKEAIETVSDSPTRHG